MAELGTFHQVLSIEFDESYCNTDAKYASGISAPCELQYSRVWCQLNVLADNPVLEMVLLQLLLRSHAGIYYRLTYSFYYKRSPVPSTVYESYFRVIFFFLVTFINRTFLSARYSSLEYLWNVLPHRNGSSLSFPSYFPRNVLHFRVYNAV